MYALLNDRLTAIKTSQKQLDDHIVCKKEESTNQRLEINKQKQILENLEKKREQLYKSVLLSLPFCLQCVNPRLSV